MSLIHHEQDDARKLLDAMSAAHRSLLSQGQAASASCIERALDELDTPSAAAIARMFERNAKP